MKKITTSLRKNISLMAISLLLAFIGSTASAQMKVEKGKRVGIIGLDTSHSPAFVKSLNSDGGSEFLGYKVVAAYPQGSRDIESSVSRIPEYTKEVQQYGVEIVSSVDELIKKVDVVLLETNDGRPHLEQALPVIKAGKPLFIDKPIAASLKDAIVIFNAARKYKVPVFTSSSLRYGKGIDEVLSGKIGEVKSAFTFSPVKYENTHPDLFWYGIHGIEPLFTVLGTGCESVVRVKEQNADLVIGKWSNGRTGTFEGIHEGQLGYGGTVFGDKGITILGGYAGYDPLLVEIIKFFNSGIAPVSEKETLEIYAFMEAADISKEKHGEAVSLESVMKKAAKEAAKVKF